MFLQIDKTALFQIIVNIVTILCCGADICVVCRLISVHYFRLSYNCKYCEIVTIFYCVQIEKSVHGKILSCEATNGGEADTSQKVSRNYRLRGPALHMDHWSCLRNFAKFYRVQRIPLPPPCWKHLVITISQLRIYEDTMLWALSTRREGLYRGSPGIVILWNVPLTPLVNMLQPDNLFAYQCRPPPTQHQTPTIKILFSAAFYAAPEKHYFIPQIFVEFIKMIKRASVSYLHFQFSISPACWVQSAQCGCCPQLRARVTQFLFPLQSTSNTTSVR